MSSTHNGVYETATGNLLRAGYVDFLNDGNFDSQTESFRTDAPFPPKVRGARYETLMHQWNGSAWILVSQVDQEQCGCLDI